MSAAPQQDHFALMGLARQFRIALPDLEQRYRALQAEVHPDRYAGHPEAEQRVAMQRSTLVNEAYLTLRSPVRRARYLLALQGVDTQEETHTAMPLDFLEQQMTLREQLAEAIDARDAEALDALAARVRAGTADMEARLADKIDTAPDLAEAAGWVRKLRFMEKLAEEIHAAYDEIDY